MRVRIERVIKGRTLIFSIIPEDEEDVEILRRVRAIQGISERLKDVRSWVRGKPNTDKTVEEFKRRTLEAMGLSELLLDPIEVKDLDKI